MFHKNLKFYRLKNNLSKKELAQSIGLSDMAITHYEKGERTPDMPTLHKLAQALNVSVVDFMSVRNEELQFEHGAFRKHSSMPQKKQEYVRENIEEYFNRFYTIVSILGASVIPPYPVYGAEKLSEVAEQDAQKLRAWLNISPEGPVGNLIDILENQGILVYQLEFENGHFSGLNGTISGRPYITINKSMSPERQRFTIAHELAHIYFAWPESLDAKSAEARTNAIAGAFLFPQEDAFRELGLKRTGIQKDMLLTAKEFGISMQCLAFRAKELKIVNGEAYTKYQIKVSLEGQRKNEPSQIAPESSNLFRQLVYRAVAEQEINPQRGAELLRVSYDEVRNATADEPSNHISVS